MCLQFTHQIQCLFLYYNYTLPIIQIVCLVPHAGIMRDMKYTDNCIPRFMTMRPVTVPQGQLSQTNCLLEPEPNDRILTDDSDVNGGRSVFLLRLVL